MSVHSTWGHDRDGLLWVASEMKALVALCPDVAQLPPEHFFDSQAKEVTRYYIRPWRDYEVTRGISVSKCNP